ncbi:paraquat-inducible protein A [Desulfocurvus sp.]|jgi:paraquat-inducible protein A|uniref:paraquat-inducible protein A n=1 Tax=Desulfocurvus sp. TaxID=2871698 RepID=UPI0025BEBBAB|nr:paraquat-inducible protein A [Desulfocurvus sp.]MCK9239726.1 paraquat-inducible protein A [Desulfocurvus sp.]
MHGTIIACHECDLLQRAVALPPGGVARCARCGAVLYRHGATGLDQVLALTVAGLILFVLANAFPLLTMRIEANVQQASLLSGAWLLADQGMAGLALLVVLTSAVIPLLKLTLLAYILLPLRLGLPAPGTARALRAVLALQPWAMMEVFLLGVLVAMVKLSSMAEIVVGPALYAFGFLVLVLAGITSSLDPRAVWDRLEIRR